MKTNGLIRLTAGTIIENKIVLGPLYLLLFVYLAALELLYFIPFEPLKAYLAPIIQKLFGDLFLHYPHHILLLPKLFQYLQPAIYVFFGSLFIPMTIDLCVQVYRQREPSLKRAFKKGIILYPYAFLILSLIISVLLLKMGLLDIVVQRATRIRSTTGILVLLKKFIIFGAPYLNLIMDIVVQSLLMATAPAMVIGPHKISAALMTNFRILKSRWLTVFGLILIPSLLHVPIHLLRATGVFADAFPETTVLLLAAGACINIFVDAFVFIGLTILCLTPKDPT